MERRAACLRDIALPLRTICARFQHGEHECHRPGGPQAVPSPVAPRLWDTSEVWGRRAPLAGRTPRVGSPRAASGPYLCRAEACRTATPTVARSRRSVELHRILWLIIGGLLGWLASILMPTTAQQGIVRNIKTRRPNGSGRRDAANADADVLANTPHEGPIVTTVATVTSGLEYVHVRAT